MKYFLIIYDFLSINLLIWSRFKIKMKIINQIHKTMQLGILITTKTVRSLHNVILCCALNFRFRLWRWQHLTFWWLWTITLFQTMMKSTKNLSSIRRDSAILCPVLHHVFQKNSFRQIEIGDFWTLITSSLNLIAFIEFNRHHCILFKSSPLLKSNCDQVHYDSVKKSLSTWTRRLIGDTMKLTIKWFFWRVNSRQVLYFNDLR